MPRRNWGGKACRPLRVPAEYGACLLYTSDGKTYLPHTLNNTCVAPPRMLIALLENNLQSDGSVKIPKVLQPYMGGKEVLLPKQ